MSEFFVGINRKDPKTMLKCENLSLSIECFHCSIVSGFLGGSYDLRRRKSIEIRLSVFPRPYSLGIGNQKQIN